MVSTEAVTAESMVVSTHFAQSLYKTAGSPNPTRKMLLSLQASNMEIFVKE